MLDEARRKFAALDSDARTCLRLPDGAQPDRYVSDFDSHVYYPRELELLFRITGFAIDAWYGDYAMRRLRTSSRQLIGVGRKT